jgi:hypothetical protein
MGAPVTDLVRPSAYPAPVTAMTPAQRLARAGAASAVATFVALMSHLLGGGAAPGPLGVAVPLLLATSLCLVLAPVRLPWLRLTVSVAVSQLLFHTLFSIGAGGAPAVAAGGAHEHAGAAMLAPGAEAMVHPGHASGAMWLAHAAAAVVTVLALRHGEAALSRVVAALRRAAHRVLLAHVPVLPVRPHVPAAPLSDERAWRPVARALTAASVVRRGPPAGVLPVSS